MAAPSKVISAQLHDLTRQILNDNLHGRKLYLLGSAEFGPTNEPKRIKTLTGLYNKFGKTGTLIDAFRAVKYISQNNDVYLVKVTGEHATSYLNVNILEGEIVRNGFILASSESNEIFNEVKVEIDIDSLSIIFPGDLNIPNHKLVYDFDEYYNIGLLAKAINYDTKNKRSFVNANYMVDPSTPTKDAFYVCNPDVVYLYGGQCGLGYSKNLLYTNLARTYDILESFPIDIVIPVDAFIDDVYPDDSEEQEYQYNMKYYHPDKDYLTPDMNGKQRSFMNQLINFCINQLNFGLVTTGVLGFNPIHTYISEYLYESDDVIKMYEACLEYNKAFCDNEPYSFLVSVVGGDLRYNMGDIVDNAYLAYGSFNASIQINTGNTNIPVNPRLALYNEFTEEALQELTDHGIVAFRHSPLYNTPVVYNGVTATTREGSQLKLYINVRMIQMCISYLNQLLQFFVGQNLNYLIKSKILEEKIQSLLAIVKSRNIINDFDFTLEPNYRAGTLKVNLSMITNYMVETINICSVINISEG